MRRKGFTIVELMMVIGIISVLVGIVSTVASSSIKASRKQRSSTLCALVQAGLSTYYAQEGKWPVNICNNPSERTNKEGDNNQHDPNKIVLNGREVRECVLEMVKMTKMNRPMMDVSGLFVSRQEGRYGQVCYGLDFMSAIRGTRESSRKMSSSEMYFGYPEESHGYFRHFKMVYSIPADSITVTTMDDDKEKAEAYE